MTWPASMPAPTDAELSEIVGGRPYDRTPTGVRVRVEQAATASVAASLLTKFPVADLTIEDPEIESVIERVRHRHHAHRTDGRPGRRGG